MECFPGGLPRKEDLDAIVPDRPVFLFNKDVHGAWVNSVALERAGITKDTPDPSDGRIERDAETGEPTGMLHEGAAYTFNDTMVPLPVARRSGRRRSSTPRSTCTRLGITAWQDAWVTPGDARRLPLAGGGRASDRAGGRRAVVGPAPGPRTDPAVPGAARERRDRQLPRHQRQDHDRRCPGELHRRAARAVLRRLRRPHRQPRARRTSSPTCSGQPSPSSTALGSRCTCTRSVTEPSETRWTPWPQPGRPTG